MPLVEQELATLPEHLSSPTDFSGVHVTRSLALCVCFIYCCLFFCPCSFGHCVVCSFSIYDSDYPFGIFKLFLLLIIVLSVLFRYIWILITSLWYLQTLLTFDHCVVCSFSIYEFWLLSFGIFKLFLLLTSVVCFFYDIYNSDYPFGIFKLFLLFAIVLSVLFRYMNSDYLPLVSSNSSYFWPLCCLFFLDIWILITSLWYLQTFLTFDHCVVCSF